MSYIEREALREELRHCCIVAFDERSGEPYVIDIPQLLRRTTVSADVAPVVHGKWIVDEHKQECSACGFKMDGGNMYSQWLFGYCPVCGCRMDGGEAEE